MGRGEILAPKTFTGIIETSRAKTATSSTASFLPTETVTVTTATSKITSIMINFFIQIIYKLENALKVRDPLPYQGCKQDTKNYSKCQGVYRMRYNICMPKKNNYYAYKLSSGKSGILGSWPETERLVKGKSARYKGFVTKKEAESWLKSGAIYQTKRSAAKKTTKLQKGIYFDAGTGRGKGVELKVTDEKGKNLLPKSKINTKHQTHRLNSATNNYGELLACKIALEIAIRKKIKKIFGDSRLVIDYWSQGHIKAKNVSEETVELSMDTANLRHKFEKIGGKIQHVSGDLNPADLGFHK